jgi:ATP-binding cassette subfamily B protein
MLALVVLANLVIIFARAGASAERVADVLETAPSVKDSAVCAPRADYSAPIIKFDNVSFCYGGNGDNALEDISVEIARGAKIGVIGGTGSGKTTLLNLIPRFYDATGGSIYIEGNSIQDYPLGSLRRMIGLVPQNARLFSGTVRSNLLIGCQEATKSR